MPVIDMVAIERRYAGQWVALSENRRRVIAAGSTLKDALALARRRGTPRPILTRIPRESLEYLL